MAIGIAPTLLLVLVLQYSTSLAHEWCSVTTALTNIGFYLRAAEMQAKKLEPVLRGKAMKKYRRFYVELFFVP